MKTARELSLETLKLEQEGRVLTARYFGSDLSFVTTSYLRDLELLTRVVDHDSSVGAVVLTGGVDRRFLTHADPDGLAGLIKYPHPPLSMRVLEPGLRATNFMLRIPGLARAADKYGGAVGPVMAWGYRWKRTVMRMNRSSTVYIAAINGPTLGGGHELALACDLRYAADADYVRLGQIELLAGLIPGGGGTQRLPGMIGTARAIEHILEGAHFSAAEALELGVVHRLFPADALLHETQTIAARMSRRSPTAVGAAKRSIYFGTSRKLRRGLDMELAGFVAAGFARKMRDTAEVFGSEVERLGETPFLADLEPWHDGTKVDQIS